MGTQEMAKRCERTFTTCLAGGWFSILGNAGRKHVYNWYCMADFWCFWGHFSAKLVQIRIPCSQHPNILHKTFQPLYICVCDVGFLDFFQIFFGFFQLTGLFNFMPKWASMNRILKYIPQVTLVKELIQSMALFCSSTKGPFKHTVWHTFVL